VRRPFQYIVVRVVPHVERGESINAGVVVYSPQLEYLAARTALDETRLRILAPRADVDAIRSQLAVIETIAAGLDGGGPIAELDRGERFHWLAAPASTVVQPSAVHTGLCADGPGILEHLFRELVLPPETG
jgi:hypothetical protein